jgi:hypothetical protein
MQLYGARDGQRLVQIAARRASWRKKAGEEMCAHSCQRNPQSLIPLRRLPLKWTALGQSDPEKP